MSPIIEDFWRRVLGSIMWFISVITYPVLVVGVLAWLVCFVGVHLFLASGV